MQQFIAIGSLKQSLKTSRFGSNDPAGSLDYIVYGPFKINPNMCRDLELETETTKSSTLELKTKNEVVEGAQSDPFPPSVSQKIQPDFLNITQDQLQTEITLEPIDWTEECG